jgi:hypothetical protein
VLGVVIAVAAAFTLTMPIDRAMLGGGSVPHYSVAHVRRVFADYGVRLHYTSHPSPKVTVLGVTPPPYAPTALVVSVPSSGRMTVAYGGTNDRVRARVRAAVAALSR